MTVHKEFEAYYIDSNGVKTVVATVDAESQSLARESLNDILSEGLLEESLLLTLKKWVGGGQKLREVTK